MPNIVILGSLTLGEYNLTYPQTQNPYLYEHDHERAYETAKKSFLPAIQEADIVFVYAPEGIGEHTQLDLDYAKDAGKRIILITKDGVEEITTYST